MQGADAVDLVAGGQAEVVHPDLAAGNDGHPVELALVVAVEGPQLFHEAAVDLGGDGVDAGHLLLVELHAPALQGLAHDGVVGVAQGAGGDVPGLVPLVVVLVHEQTHELGNAEGGMGVVDVDGYLVGQGAQGLVALDVAPQDGLQGGRAEEILLAQAQALALDVVVGGIEDLGKGLGHGVLLQGAHVVAPGEGRHVEALGELGGPEDQLVHRIGVVAGDVEVVGNGHDGGVAVLGHLELAVVIPLPDLAAEADLHRVVLLGDQPDVAHLEPVVGELHLPAVHDLLLEDAELVADGVAGGGIAETGEGVQVAGGQAAQAAVAQARVGIQGVEIRDVDVQILQSLGEDLLHAEVEEVVAQGGAHQEFHGHIEDLLAALLLIAALEGAAAVIHAVADHGAQGLVGLLVGGLIHIAAKQAHTGLVQQLDCFLFRHIASKV